MDLLIKISDFRRNQKVEKIHLKIFKNESLKKIDFRPHRTKLKYGLAQI